MFNCVTPKVKVILTNKSGFADEKIVENVLYGKDVETIYLKTKQNDLFDGIENYIRFSDSSQNNPQQLILKKISNQGDLLGDVCKVSQGILSGVDKIREKHLEMFPSSGFRKGAGVYVISKDEYSQLKSGKSIIKPWFKNSDIHKYYTNEINNEFLIYATRNLQIENYPEIHEHFLKYQDVINSRNQGRGEIQAALKLGKWWVIFAARAKTNFEDEKIVAPQRSYSNTFGFNNVPWYASADVYYITKNDETNSINLKYVLGLLNSKLYYLWLYNKGKRKGEMLELYEKPLSEIPIKIIPVIKQAEIAEIVDEIIEAKKQDAKSDTSKLECKIDKLVYQLYGLTDEEIRIVEGKE